MSGSATAIRFDPDTHARLQAAAKDHDRSINWIVNRAVNDYLARLLPAKEVVWTRPHLPDTRTQP